MNSSLPRILISPLPLLVFFVVACGGNSDGQDPIAPNQPPSASIETPTGDSSVAGGSEVTFRGAGQDAEDGELSGSSLTWRSDIDELLGTGRRIQVVLTSDTAHIVSLEVTDSDGATATDSVAVTVSNRPPAASIQAPSQDTTISGGDTLNLQGTSDDPEDGRLTGNSLEWGSDIDGQLGTGETVQVTLASDTIHKIRLTATDSEGAEGDDSVFVNVIEPLAESVIAFAADTVHDNDPNIWLVNPDGSGLHLLASSPEKDYRPVWSPNGQRVVFRRSDASGSDLYVVSLGGTNLRQLTTEPGLDFSADWSPDGTKIAFETDRAVNRDIAVIRPDGTDFTNLTQDSAASTQPRWSPDGNQIALVRTPLDSASGLYVMDADGSNLRRLIDAGDQPAWSPDGAHIAMSILGDSLTLVEVATGEKTNLAGADASARPRWSPNGEWIAFTGPGTGGIGDTDVFIIHPDGTGLRNLTPDPASDFSPYWSPSGNQLVFTRERISADIYIINTDGTGLTRLTKDIATGNFPVSPAWSPVRSQ